MRDLYPIAVIQDRYSGAYSGGEWIAIGDARAQMGDAETRLRFCLEAEDGPSGGDTDAASFWNRAPSWVASGPTPNDAVEALLKKQ